MVRLLAIASFGLFFLLCYQNCAPMELSESFGSNSKTPVQCVAKLRVKTLNERVIAPTTCEKLSEYKCDHHIFSPDVRSVRSDVGSARTERLKCIAVGEHEHCISTQRFEHDTSHLLSAEAPESFLPGSEYNREEYSCYHKGLLTQGLALIPGEGATLESALIASREACLQEANR